ncbi:hypothetical protein ACYBUP_28085, partial [Klebsiella pneumoniae]
RMPCLLMRHPSKIQSLPMQPQSQAEQPLSRTGAMQVLRVLGSFFSTSKINLMQPEKPTPLRHDD